MKTRLIFVAVLAAMLVAAAAFTAADRDGVPPRYHQHLRQPDARELGECPVCGGGAELCTHLPIIRISTGGQKIPGKSIYDQKGNFVGYETGENGETEIPVTVETVEGEGVYHHAADPADVTAAAMLRIRGHSSRIFSKSSYRIKLYENGDPEDGADLPLLGMDPGGEWALHGPFLDKTLVRNYMWMNISAEVMGDAPDVRFCEVILDGEYRGLYLLMEPVNEGPGRVELTEYEEGNPMCSYILRIGGHLNPQKTLDTFSFYTFRLEPNKEVELLYPPKDFQTEAVKSYVETDFNAIEKLLYSDRMARGEGGYRELIDVESFVNYYILQEFLAVNDAFSESTYFYRDVRGKLHVGPVWDYNNVLDNYITPMPEEGFLLAQRGWFARLMMDEAFVERVIARWEQLREGVLSDRRLNAYIDGTVEWLGGAVERNFEVWGFSFDPSRLGRRERRRPNRSGADNDGAVDPAEIAALNPSSHGEAVADMRGYMIRRAAWIDRHIDSLRRYCRESKNAALIVD